MYASQKRPESDLVLSALDARALSTVVATLLTGFLLAFVPAPREALAQTTGAIQVDTTSSYVQTHSPRKALQRALMVPGWGQYYNKQYLKVPVVYAGFAGIAAGAVYYTRRHRRFDRAFLFIRSEELVAVPDNGVTENEYLRFEGTYNDLVAEVYGGTPVTSSTLRGPRDNFRRNRDLFYFGIGLWYGLTLLDAYVSAHLLDFDVSEDLTLALLPHRNGFQSTLRYRF